MVGGILFVWGFFWEEFLIYNHISFFVILKQVFNKTIIIHVSLTETNTVHTKTKHILKSNKNLYLNLKTLLKMSHTSICLQYEIDIKKT